MAPSRQELREIALDIVAEGDEPDFYELVRRIRSETGAGHADANRTVFELRRRGAIRVTMSGGFVVRSRSRGSGSGGGGHMLGIVAALLGILGSLLGIWEIAVRNGAIAGPGPIGIVFPNWSGVPNPTLGPMPSPPAFPTGAKLEAPAASISGNCETGFTITWTAIEGAENYRLEEDGHFYATKYGTEHFVPAKEVFEDRRYTVFATALLRPRSDASNPVVAEKC